MDNEKKQETSIITQFGHEIFGGVRVVERENEPWFVGKDVCDCLGYSNSRETISKLDEDERDCVRISDAIGRGRETIIINESGLYTLIMRSSKPEAKAFRKWVTSEVLPSIRKKGWYMSPQLTEMLQNTTNLVESFHKRLENIENNHGFRRYNNQPSHKNEMYVLILNSYDWEKSGYWEHKTITEILMDCGILNPTVAQLKKGGFAIRSILDIKKAPVRNGYGQRFYRVPSRYI